ncbi:hypothetical protein H4219_003842 [Mycoemilia scoparia]|uniref:Uncharacterized protein n=1 Tax=Mycoemilia scoparia TaxID=417184 RepID=A0A9W8A302_9FUNG|nr:hypothetical protein H4219_003842 [Mycoemilia scoparia]
MKVQIGSVLAISFLATSTIAANIPVQYGQVHFAGNTYNNLARRDNDTNNNNPNQPQPGDRDDDDDKDNGGQVPTRRPSQPTINPRPTDKDDNDDDNTKKQPTPTPTDKSTKSDDKGNTTNTGDKDKDTNDDKDTRTKSSPSTSAPASDKDGDSESASQTSESKSASPSPKPKPKPKPKKEKCSNDGAQECTSTGYRHCKKGYWEPGTCKAPDVCMLQKDKTTCVSPEVANAKPCDDEGQTRCIGDLLNEFQMCSNGRWMKSTCDNDNVCKPTDDGKTMCISRDMATKITSIADPGVYVPPNGAGVSNSKEFNNGSWLGLVAILGVSSSIFAAYY